MHYIMVDILMIHEEVRAKGKKELFPPSEICQMIVHEQLVSTACA